MISIRLLFVGAKPRRAWELLGELYRGRLTKRVRWEEVRIPLAVGRQSDPKGAVLREGKVLLTHLGPQDRLVVLDERGSLWTTEDLARFLHAHPVTVPLALAIGSDLGLSQEVKSQAHHLWSLSPLTLPHEMVRVMVMEQIYRALDLLAGGKYHRASFEGGV